jgi:hypothetical protein
MRVEKPSQLKNPQKKKKGTTHVSMENHDRGWLG